MGYELHITRADSWLDAGASPIPSEVWDRLVAADQSLSVPSDNFYRRKDGNGGTVQIPAVVWSADSEVVFWFDEGEVTVKNPSDATIVKMIELASKLEARVFGDDDEEYFPSPTPPGYVAKRAEAALPAETSRPWWKFW